MTETLVGADLDLAADVGGDLATEVTLHLVGAFDVVAEGDELVVGEVLDADRLVDLGGLEDLDRAGTADAVDVREGDHHALVARDVDAGKTCHAVTPGVLWRCGAGSVPGPPPEVSPPAPVPEPVEGPGAEQDLILPVSDIELFLQGVSTRSPSASSLNLDVRVSTRLRRIDTTHVSPGAACGAGCSCRSP